MRLLDSIECVYMCENKEPLVKPRALGGTGRKVSTGPLVLSRRANVARKLYKESDDWRHCEMIIESLVCIAVAVYFEARGEPSAGQLSSSSSST